VRIVTPAEWNLLTVLVRPGTETAAQASAAFSACSLLYGSSNQESFAPASLQNASYSSTLLSHATSLHTFATNATGGLGLTQKVVPALADAYGASSYGDDLTLSALFLSWAANSSDHYREAEGYYMQYALNGQDSVFNWDDKAPALPVLFTQLATLSPGITTGANRSMTSWQEEAETYFDGILNGKSRGKLTKGT
jgi:endoglucanase